MIKHYKKTFLQVVVYRFFKKSFKIEEVINRWLSHPHPQTTFFPIAMWQVFYGNYDPN